MERHEVVAHGEWVERRKALLVEEKEFTRRRDELSRRRRELPWEPVSKEYAFEGARGRQTLADLFGGQGQLVVYHFMFGPEWDAGCPHCSFWADNFNPNIAHLAAIGVAMVAVSRAPYAKIAAYRARMGWTFPWLSSHGSDFNHDFGVSFSPEQIAGGAVYNYRPGNTDPEREGLSVFYRDEEGSIFHTYSTYARGIDIINTAYNILDLVPLGRQEEGRDPQYWVRRHDEYGT
jgi:predicted dithiol-disulfide oxidoreductase (DUF899 family)